MRRINLVRIINAQGEQVYSVGQEVNGLKIAVIELYANDGMTELIVRDQDKNLVVNIVNCPMIIEYAEVNA